jgi:hypothetical protein
MSNVESNDVASRARAYYEAKLKDKLTATNADDFVSIEPESGDYFVADTLSGAIQAARAAHPDRLPFTLRIGHVATVELGVVLS